MLILGFILPKDFERFSTISNKQTLYLYLMEKIAAI